MGEIITVEKSAVIGDGKAALEEKRCQWLLEEDGSVRLLACCGKRFPLQPAEAAQVGLSPAPKQNRAV